MIEVKNLLFQPLSLHTRDGRGLHLGPRQRLRLPDDDVSLEMEAAARRGAVSLSSIEETDTNELLQTQDSPSDPDPEPAVRTARRKRS